MKMRIDSWKKGLALGAAGLMIGVGGGVAIASHSFTDVSNGSWYHDSVDFLETRNITSGCEGGTVKYCPNRNVTRAEMSAFLVKTARALSPVVLTDTQSGLTEDVNACVIGPHVPEFEQVAVFNGGLYAQGEGPVDSRVQYRADGGPWLDVSGAWYIRQTAAASPAYGNAPVVGYRNLTPGVSYEFSIDAANVGSGAGSAGCQLTAVIHHRMPDGGGALAALDDAPADQGFVD